MSATRDDSQAPGAQQFTSMAHKIREALVSLDEVIRHCERLSPDLKLGVEPHLVAVSVSAADFLEHVDVLIARCDDDQPAVRDALTTLRGLIIDRQAALTRALGGSA